jgi:hypothetical protein
MIFADGGRNKAAATTRGQKAAATRKANQLAAQLVAPVDAPVSSAIA